MHRSHLRMDFCSRDNILRNQMHLHKYVYFPRYPIAILQNEKSADFECLQVLCANGTGLAPTEAELRPCVSCLATEQFAGIRIATEKTMQNLLGFSHGFLFLSVPVIFLILRNGSVLSQ